MRLVVAAFVVVVVVSGFQSNFAPAETVDRVQGAGVAAVDQVVVGTAVVVDPEINLAAVEQRRRDPLMTEQTKNIWAGMRSANQHRVGRADGMVLAPVLTHGAGTMASGFRERFETSWAGRPLPVLPPVER